MNKQLKGAILISISAIFFGSYGVWSKIIGTSLDNFFQVYIRSLLILLIIIPFGFITHSFKKVDKKDWKWIAVYSLLGSLTVAPIFYAYNKIGIGSATLLFYASFTIISFIVGYFSFSEKITKLKAIALLFSLLGLYLIFDLSLRQDSLIAALCAIISGSAGGAEVAYTKKVSDRYSAVQLNIFTWGVIFIVHIIGSFLLNERQIMPSFSLPWLGILGYALASLFAFTFVVIGYRFVNPAVGALTGLLEIIFGILFGVVFFSELISYQIVLGGIFIFIAAALPNIKSFIRTIKIT